MCFVNTWIASTDTMPDHVMIQTWEANPSRIVPESDPDTMTGYLKWFIEQTNPPPNTETLSSVKRYVVHEYSRLHGQGAE
jgi:hypothetical protein